MSTSAAVAPNSPNALQEALCENNPCIVCWAREQLAASPATAAFHVDERPLRLNLVGLRQEDTLSDQFDDHMLVFFRLLHADQKSAFETKIAEELRKSTSAMFGPVKDLFKCVPCSNGYWVVGLFPVSTDPGFGKDIEPAKANLSSINASLDKKKKELDQLNAKKKEAAAAPEAGKQKPKKRGTLSKLDDQIAKLKKKIETLEQKKSKATRDISDAEKENAGNVAVPEHLGASGTADPTPEGWYDQGRAILPPAIYAGKYQLSAHHAHTIDGFSTSSAALCIGNAPGFRIYTPAGMTQSFLDAALEKKKHEDDAETAKWTKHHKKGEAQPQPAPFTFTTITYDIGQRKIGPDKVRYDEGKASIRIWQEAPGKQELKWQVTIHGQVESIPKDEILLVRDPVGGTNIHRAHHIGFDEATGKLKLVQASGRVRNWSEGCQVFPDFDHYNFFIRLAGVSRAWHCEHCTSPRCDFLKGAPGDALGPGETALMQGLGEWFICLSAASVAKKVHKECEKTAGKLRSEIARKGWTTKDEDQLTTLANDLKRLEEDSPAYDQKQAQLDGLSARRSAAVTDDEWNEAEQASKEAEQLGTVHRELDKRGKWLCSESQKPPEPTLSAASASFRRDFLRDRARVIGGDFARSCDFVSPACGHRFTYTLTEVSISEFSQAKILLESEANADWNGSLILDQQ